ncbi:DNA-directed RNA polymerase III subunit RPC7 isoform X1 [Chaetodon trifascialis]|uniref:DNA-directed RNA polymerase III subunit RPC7 isoform X1 n=1 Tax=Chaetodon trifascialis TaxID=109706 RepID=UPI0039947A70
MILRIQIRSNLLSPVGQRGLAAMAGKGRGVAAFSFHVEALGIGRGNMPEARVGPSPLFPNTDFKPLPLKAGEDEDYMLALKQEMRGTMQRLPHHIRPPSNKAEVEKYTERYLKQSQMEDEEWSPELMPQTKRRHPKPGTKKKPVISRKHTEDMLSKLDELEKKDDGNVENSDDETEKKTKNENDEEELEEEEYEEEDIEEENDYIESYFDNGEDFAADSDDNMDGEATY